MGGLSIWHWLIVLAVVLILFGSGRVGSLLGELGKGVKAFKQNVTDTPDTLPRDASGALPRDASMAEPAPEESVIHRTTTKTTVRNG